MSFSVAIQQQRAVSVTAPCALTLLLGGALVGDFTALRLSLSACFGAGASESSVNSCRVPTRPLRWLRGAWRSTPRLTRPRRLRSAPSSFNVYALTLKAITLDDAGEYKVWDVSKPTPDGLALCLQSFAPPLTGAQIHPGSI